MVCELREGGHPIWMADRPADDSGSSESASRADSETRAASKRARGSMLQVVAQSIVAAAPDATIVDVVQGRLAQQYGGPLLAYLALRLRSTDAARRAMEELRQVAVAAGMAELSKPPGLRARLFRTAREVAERRTTTPPSPPNVQYRAASALGTKPEIVERLRGGLLGPTLEILELAHARELTHAEIAFVIGVEEAEVPQRLETAEAIAMALAGEKMSELTMERAIADAFAVDVQPESAKLDVQSDALAPGTRIGERYAILHRVGSGAFGDVYKAEDAEVPGHVVALKLLRQPATNDLARNSALRELHLIASVFHPSIVQFKDHGWHENRMWFVMPWYDGETLESRIARAPLGRAEARRIFQPLARALGTMHAVGLRHQDIKPENIFLARIKGFGREDGEEEILPVLLDLGVAAKQAEMLLAGTPTYFAPEVASHFAKPGEGRPISAASDVFSLALALRDALEPETREEPTSGAVEKFIEHRAEDPPSPPKREDLAYLAPLFARALSTDAAARPTAEELAQELAILTAPEERAAARRATLRWAIPTAASVVAVFASVVFFLMMSIAREEREAELASERAIGLEQDLALTEAERAALDSQRERLLHEYDQSELDRHELASRLSETETDRNRIRANVRRLESIIERARQDLAHRIEELGTARESIATLEARVAERANELAAAEARTAETNRSLAAAQGELAAAQQALETARAESATASSRVAELTQQIERTQSEIAAARVAQNALEQRNAELERRVRELEAQQAAPTPVTVPVTPPQP